MKVLVLILATFVLLTSGCIQQEYTGPSIQEQAKSKCIELCKSAKIDLSNGPCLSDDNPDWDVNDWVCDVAHSPRETVDNLHENQCQEFREGKASHFVEVGPDCKFIKVA